MTGSNAPGGIYLNSYLAAFQDYLTRDDVTDIYVNGPGELWVETLSGGLSRHAAPALDTGTLDRLSRQIAAFANQGINREHPLLSATLPDGSRVQIIAPPATRGDHAIAIRKHVAQDLSIADIAATGSFSGTISRGSPRGTVDETLAQLRDVGDIPALLIAAVRARRNILVSGGTSTGKTTFLNALLREIPQHERLILIEDTPELRLGHPNAIGLLAARGELGEARVTADDLLTASLRMRPDRIIVGELRGPEALTFLRAVNTGHPGSMTTIHADSTTRAVEQLVLLVLQAGSGLTRGDIAHYIRTTIDVYVQLERVGGARSCGEVRLAQDMRESGN